MELASIGRLGWAAIETVRLKLLITRELLILCFCTQTSITAPLDQTLIVG
jgi:hypothetical protein